jgi:hypothetical protein
MTNEQAGTVLGLPLSASADDIEGRYQELYSEYQIRIDNAPTAMLRERYARVLNEVEEARQTLLRGAAQPAAVDLPSERRVPAWQAEGGRPAPPREPSRAPGIGGLNQPPRRATPPHSLSQPPALTPAPRGPISLPEPPQKSASRMPLIIGGAALLLLIVKVASSGGGSSANASTTVSDTSTGTIAPAPAPETDTTLSDWNGWLRTTGVRAEMRVMDSIFAAKGLHREAMSFVSHGVAKPGLDYYTDVTFPGGAAYLLAGLCDDQCTRMRLEVRDTTTGRLVVQSNGSPTDNPIVTFPVQATATYRVLTHVDRCAADACNFGVRAFTASPE